MERIPEGLYTPEFRAESTSRMSGSTKRSNFSEADRLRPRNASSSA